MKSLNQVSWKKESKHLNLTKEGVWNFTGQGATHSHTASASNTGSGTAHNNMMPYITVRMWKRTA